MKTPSHEIDNSELIRELADPAYMRNLSSLLQRATEALRQAQPEPDAPPVKRTYKSRHVEEGVLLEAWAGVSVGTFFEEVVKMRKDYGEYDGVVAVFNDRYFKIYPDTTVDELLKAYR
jgi:hypothetical protein